MAKHLSDSDIERICQIIDSWTERKFSWNALVVEVSRQLGISAVRQTLQSHVRIKDAYDLRKKNPVSKSGVQRRTSLTFAKALDRIDTLEAENLRLRQENERLLEQFLVWQFNARNKGMSKEDLSKARPPIDRGTDEG